MKDEVETGETNLDESSDYWLIGRVRSLNM